MSDDGWDLVYLDPLCRRDSTGRALPQLVIPPPAWQPAGGRGEVGGRWGRIKALVIVNGAEAFIVAAIDSQRR